MYFQGVSQSQELPGNAKIKSISRKCSNQKYCQEVSQVKVQPGSATIIRTARVCHKQNASIISTGSVTIKNTSREFTFNSTDRECHNQKYCQRLSHGRYYQGVLLFKIHPGNATIKYTAGECHKPKWLQGVSQSKDCQGISRQISIKIKRIAGKLTIKVLPGSATLLMTKGSITVKTIVMVNHNQNGCQEVPQEYDCKEVSQFNFFQGSIKIKRTAVLSQAKGLQGTVIVKMTAQDFHN